jgi:hypothetical protein
MNSLLSTDPFLSSSSNLCSCSIVMLFRYMYALISWIFALTLAFMRPKF